ncbi:MAG TPA: hypothetical protein EYO73_04210 [Sulfurimonas sp.]|nr:hypothetical protein [Sulfurimonas sp.]
MVDSEQYENFTNNSVHLIRNMVDHGIETKEERIRNNKLPEGLIKIHFILKEKSFQIIFEDDGQGINTQMVKNKIIEKRLATEKELSQFSEKEIFSFLFTPGFSTKTQVTDLSGRGVGLDSVKNEIDSLGGDIEIESQPGKGSKFVIELPLFK